MSDKELKNNKAIKIFASLLVVLVIIVLIAFYYSENKEKTESNYVGIDTRKY